MSKTRQSRCSVVYWVPVVLWMGVIFYFSSRTSGELGDLLPLVLLPELQWGHLGEYLILGVFSYFALSRTVRGNPNLWAILICLAYGVTDEWHQSFVPTRAVEGGDLIMDLVGAIIGVVLILLWKRIRSLKRLEESGC